MQTPSSRAHRHRCLDLHHHRSWLCPRPPPSNPRNSRVARSTSTRAVSSRRRSSAPPRASCVLPTPGPASPLTTTSPTHPIPIQHIAAAATLQATLYTSKIEEATATDVGTYSTTNSAFTDAFTGHYRSGRASIAPKSSDCKQAHAPHMHRTFAPHTQSHAFRTLHPLRTPTPGVPRPRVCEATATPTRRVRAVHDIRKECQRRRERE